jgi:hypothetical protein
MRRTTHAIAFLLACAWSNGVAQEASVIGTDDDELAEPIVVRHPPLLVYFVDAPRSIVTMLRRAVRAYCGTQGLQDQRITVEYGFPHASKAICNGARIRYVHAINYRNDSNGYGYACIDSNTHDDVVFPEDYEAYFKAKYRCLTFYRDKDRPTYEFEPSHD